jgi:hypothetical protein
MASSTPVGGMIYAIVNWNTLHEAGFNPLQAPKIVAVLMGL